MAIESFEGIHPTIHESVFIAASADVVGRVTIAEESSVWYNATLRGDINEITIGPRSNVLIGYSHFWRGNKILAPADADFTYAQWELNF